MPTEHQLRQEIIKFSHLCYERNLLVAMDGNLSALLPSGEVLCTKAGCHKGFVTDDDLVVVDGASRLNPGASVTIKETPQADKAKSAAAATSSHAMPSGGLSGGALGMQ